MGIIARTGITGQDGSYLAKFLLEKGHRVVGLTRHSSTATDERLAHLVDHRIELIQGDLLDQASLIAAIESAGPAEVYNLAAHSFIPTSWTPPTVRSSGSRSFRRDARVSGSTACRSGMTWPG